MALELNTIYNEDCLETMKRMPDGFVDLVVSSPPYFNLRDYANWETYESHLNSVSAWFSAMFRVLKQGRHIAWNIQDNTPEPTKNGRHYYALMPDTIKIAQNFGFEWDRNIIWSKNNATQVMFGSYPYPPNMIYSTVTESICIFRKPGKTDLSNKSDESKVPQKEWNYLKNNLWTFTPQTKSSHPAPYPIELPTRVIKMHSFVGDTVYDPFMGSGTTARACKDLNRNYIGSEISKEYCDIAEERLRQEVLV